MADINVPFICSKCELATFSSLQELRFHLENEHALSLNKSRNRVRMFNGYFGEENFRKQDENQIHKGLPLNAYESSSYNSMTDKYLEIEDPLSNRLFLDMPSSDGISSSYENAEEHLGTMRPHFSTISEETVYPHLLREQNDKHHTHDLLSSNIRENSFAKSRNLMEQNSPDEKFKTNLKSEESHLEEAVATLSNKVIHERIKEQAISDSLYNTQEVMHGMEIAAERKVQQQQEIIESLSQELKEKENKLTTLTEQMEHLSSEQDDSLKRFSELKEKLEAENDTLNKSMMEKEEQMNKLNEKIETVRLTFLKGNTSQDTGDNNELVTKEHNTNAQSGLFDRSPTKEVSVSRIHFSPQNSINDMKEVSQEHGRKSYVTDEKERLKQSNSSTLSQDIQIKTGAHDEEFIEMKNKSLQLEKDREHLLLDMQSLLSTAESDKKKLQEELQHQGDHVGHLHSDLEKCRREQTELLGETGALFGQANLYFNTLKSFLAERENKLPTVSNILDGDDKNGAMEIWSKGNNPIQTYGQEKTLNNAQRDMRKQNLPVYGRKPSELQPELQKQYEQYERTERQIAKWNIEREKHAMAHQKLRESVQKKEEKLKKYRQEWKNLQIYLDKTAKKEHDARSKLETFISHLMDRASRAETELSSLKNTLARHEYGMYPDKGPLRGQRKGSLDPQALPGLNDLVGGRSRSPEQSHKPSKSRAQVHHSAPGSRRVKEANSLPSYETPIAKPRHHQRHSSLQAQGYPRYKERQQMYSPKAAKDYLLSQRENPHVASAPLAASGYTYPKEHGFNSPRDMKTQRKHYIYPQSANAQSYLDSLALEPDSFGNRKFLDTSDPHRGLRRAQQYKSMPDVRRSSGHDFSYSPLTYKDSYQVLSPNYGTPNIVDQYGRPLFQNTPEVNGMVDNVRRRRNLSKAKRKLSLDEDGIMWNKSNEHDRPVRKYKMQQNAIRPSGGISGYGARGPANQRRSRSYPRVTEDAMSSLQENPLPLGEKIGKLLTSIDSQPLSSRARESYDDDTDNQGGRFVSTGTPRRSARSSKGNTAPVSSLAPKIESTIVRAKRVRNNNGRFAQNMIDSDQGRKPLFTAPVSSLAPAIESPIVRAKHVRNNNSIFGQNMIESDQGKKPLTTVSANGVYSPHDTKSRRIENSILKPSVAKNRKSEYSENVNSAPTENAEATENRNDEHMKRASPLLRAKSVQKQVKDLQKKADESSNLKSDSTPGIVGQPSLESVPKSNLRSKHMPSGNDKGQENWKKAQSKDNTGITPYRYVGATPQYMEPHSFENTTGTSAKRGDRSVEELHPVESNTGISADRSLEETLQNKETRPFDSSTGTSLVHFKEDIQYMDESQSDTDLPSPERETYGLAAFQPSTEQNDSQRESLQYPNSTFPKQDLAPVDSSRAPCHDVNANSEIEKFADKLVSEEMNNAIVILSSEGEKSDKSLSQAADFYNDDLTYSSHSNDQSIAYVKDGESGQKVEVDVDDKSKEMRNSVIVQEKLEDDFKERKVESVDSDASTIPGDSESIMESKNNMDANNAREKRESSLQYESDETESQAGPLTSSGSTSTGINAQVVGRSQSVDVGTDTDADLDSKHQNTDTATDTDQESMRSIPGQKKKLKSYIKHKHPAKKVRSNPARALLSQESVTSSADEVDDSQKAKRQALRRKRKCLLLVFSYLDTETLLTVSEVCRDWYHVSRSSALWRKVTLKDKQISSQFLITLSRWCTKTEVLVLQGLRGRGISSNEEPQEYADNIRGNLEQGLEKVLAACQDTITSIHIEDCDNILTDKCLWLISGYCRLLTRLTYRSALDPVTGQLIWALGGGCPGISSLCVQPLHPRSETNNLNNHCLLLIGQFYSELREVGLGGKQFDTAGLLPLVQSCQRLYRVHLEYCLTFSEDMASALCRAGLKHLETLSIKGTGVEAKALEILQGHCRHLKRVDIKMRLEDCVEDLTKKKERENYKKMVKTLEDLKSKPGFGNIIKLDAVPLEEKASGFLSFFSRS